MKAGHGCVQDPPRSNRQVLGAVQPDLQKESLVQELGTLKALVKAQREQEKNRTPKPLDNDLEEIT